MLVSSFIEQVVQCDQVQGQLRRFFGNLILESCKVANHEIYHTRRANVISGDVQVDICDCIVNPVKPLLRAVKGKRDRGNRAHDWNESVIAALPEAACLGVI